MAIQRLPRSDRWDEESDSGFGGAAQPGGKTAFKPLTREEALALRAKDPPLSPWWVIGMQAALGAVVALLAALLLRRMEVVWSVLYGAAVVVVPGALMARGMTSRLSSMTLAISAVSVMSWSMVKIGVSVCMLMLAPKVVPALSWPALLVAMVLCMKIYWLALLWRGRTNKN